MNRCYYSLSVLFVMSFCLALAGCAGFTPPPNAEQYVAAIKSKEHGTMKEQVVEQNITNINKVMAQKAEICFSAEINTTHNTFHGLEVSDIAYYSSLHISDSRHSRLVIQQAVTPNLMLNSMPRGGYYAMVADFERIQENKTRVTIYGPSFGYGKFYDAIFAWSAGQEQRCPLEKTMIEKVLSI